MFGLLVVLCGADPAITVVNHCPPALVVVNHCPAVKAKPVKVTNGFNCGAGFCGANGGAGCPSCPNGNGVCACGPKEAARPAASPAFVLPASMSSCPGGNCPQSAGFTPLFRFRR